MSEEREKMAAMNRWLDVVCADLGVDRDVVAEVTPALLALIKHVAHGPSRPGAPLTAFTVGLASGIAIATQGSDQVTAIKQRVADLEELVEQWAEEAHSAEEAQ